MRCSPSSSLGDLILGELVRNRGLILAIAAKKMVVMETKMKTVLAVKMVVMV